VNLPKKFSKESRRIHRQKIRKAHEEYLQENGLEGRFGEVWVWSCIDAAYKYILPDVIGSRSRRFGSELFEKIIGMRSNPDDDLLFQTDGYDVYQGLIAEYFASEILNYRNNHYNDKIPKTYTIPEHILYTMLTKKRNDHGEIESVEGTVIFGAEDRILNVLKDHNPKQGINTSYIERQNLSKRHFNARLRRKTIAYSKEYDCLVSQLHLHRMYQNFCWSHHTLRKQYGIDTSPAMAIGATDHIWQFHEIFRVPIY